jgi:hypothetical protein
MTLQSGFSATGRCNRRYGSAGSAPRFMRVNCKSADAACFPSAAVLPPTQLRSLRQNCGASSGTFLTSPAPLTISPSSYPAANGGSVQEAPGSEERRRVRTGGRCGAAEGEERRWMRSWAGAEWPSVRSGAGCGACQSEDAVEEEERTWAPLGFPSCCEVRNASAARLTARDGERTASVRQVNTDRCEATFARMLKLNRRRAITRGAPSGCGIRIELTIELPVVCCSFR